VAGDVRPADARARIEKHFAKLKGSPVAHPDFSRIEPEQLGERRLTAHQKVRVASYRLAWHVPRPGDSLYPAANALAGVLGSGRSSRLHRLLVTDSALATQVACYASAERDPGALWISVAPKSDSLIPGIERLVFREVERLRTELVTERELRRVKNRILAADVFDQDEVMWTAIGLAQAQVVEGSWRSELDFRERIERVTAEEVRSFAQEWLKPDRRTVGILLPEVKK
jgi:zinc protease